MKVSTKVPTPQILEAYLDHSQHRPLSYTERGHSQQNFTAGYDNDHYKIALGRGEAVWEAAKRALRHWQQFPAGWTGIYPANAPLVVGQEVTVSFRLFGIWWINSARIIYTIDEADRFGFAYGTVVGHIESGEECFWIERSADGQIHYHIRAFSKPHHWLVRLAYPLARYHQKRFGHESTTGMRNLAQAQELTKA